MKEKRKGRTDERKMVNQGVKRISKEEVRTVMKGGIAVSPDERKADFLTSLSNPERMNEELTSVLVQNQEPW